MGWRTHSLDQLVEEGKEIAGQNNAHWADAITCVQKVFSAKDLPATFEIDCPTPKGQYPVYPRMMFLRREVVAPGAHPLPLPPGAVQARTETGAGLLSMPYPFLSGTEAPVAVKPRPTRTIKFPLTYLQYVDDNGEVLRQGTLRWPKVASEKGRVIAGAVILTGQIQGLPAGKLAAARLLVPVTQGHNKAPGKLGVVFMGSPVEPGKPIDVTQLNDIAGSAIIPQQPASQPDYQPAKVFPIDVTRGIQAVASGETKFQGLALRIVPDRSVDDGYTVHCDVSAAGPIYLEVEVYTD
jgi:hypothetical protein